MAWARKTPASQFRSTVRITAALASNHARARWTPGRRPPHAKSGRPLPLLRNLGIAKVDLIKIDCEGAELEILAGLPEEVRRGCKWITGEMHDSSAFKLLALLAPHFDPDLRKTMFQPKFRFHACNSTLTPALRGQFDSAAFQT